MAATDTTAPLPLPAFNKPVKLLIVQAPFQTDISDALLEGATAALTAANVGFETITVPGVLEIPSAIAIAERMSNYDGYVALGCLLRGQSRHHKVLASTTYQALSQMGLNGISIGNGILTAKNINQAKAQANASDHNNGGAAAIAALHLVALSRKWGRETKGIGFKPASSDFLMADSPDNGPKTA